MYEPLDWKDKIRNKMKEKERMQKNYAHGAVSLAIKTGKLKRESCKCGSMEVEAHYMDYDRPLEVIWACKKHHAELDKMKRELDSFEELSPSLSPFIGIN